MNSRSIKTIALTAIVTLALSFVARVFLAKEFSAPLFSEAIAQTDEAVAGSMPKNWDKVIDFDRSMGKGLLFVLQADDGTVRLVTWNFGSDGESLETKGALVFKRN